MRATIEVQIGDGEQRPLVRKVDGKWIVTAPITPGCVAYSRAVWVRSYKPGRELPADGSGLLIGPTYRLTKG